MVKRQSSKVVYETPFVKVFEDEVEYDNGVKGVYSYLERRNFSSIIPYTGHSFILVKQYRYPIQQFSIEFPAGSHQAEPKMDPLKLAAAELQEETGYSADKFVRVGAVHTAPGSFTSTFTVFVATGLHPGKQKLDLEEAGLEILEIPTAEFEQMLRDNKIQDGPTLAGYGLAKARGII
ncbi:MAG TPA: NUDIX hydrolase [Candidatus Saccharimonadia bacterium]|nr:NUDIX hydrolase [Candidatus Saccharimonadia bacterium]